MARNWNDLPNEMKFMIVDRMDIVTRTKLKMCSKSDRCIVESVPMHVEEFTALYITPGESAPIARFQNEPFLISPTRLLQIESFCLKEIDEGKFEKTIDGKSHPFELPKRLRKYRGKHLFKKFVGNLLLRRNLHIDWFRTETDFPSKLSNTTINAKNAFFGGKSEEVMKWIKVLSPKTKNIMFDHCDEGVLEGIGLIPVIINTERLDIYRKNDITDEQLMTFKCTKGWINDSKITRNGAMQFIQKIASSDYPLDTKIKLSIEESEIDEELDEIDEETRLCLPMNSEKEVVYFYQPGIYLFAICVQKAGEPEKTYDQLFGYAQLHE